MLSFDRQIGKRLRRCWGMSSLVPEPEADSVSARLNSELNLCTIPEQVKHYTRDVSHGRKSPNFLIAPIEVVARSAAASARRLFVHAAFNATRRIWDQHSRKPSYNGAFCSSKQRTQEKKDKTQPVHGRGCWGRCEGRRDQVTGSSQISSPAWQAHH